MTASGEFPSSPTSANDGSGIADLADAVSAHYSCLSENADKSPQAGLAARRRNAARVRLMAAAQTRLQREIQRLEDDLVELTEDVAERRLTPGRAAQQLIDKAFKE